MGPAAGRGCGGRGCRGGGVVGEVSCAWGARGRQDSARAAGSACAAAQTQLGTPPPGGAGSMAPEGPADQLAH